MRPAPWLGWQDSNLRMLGSKPSALPTWRHPNSAPAPAKLSNRASKPILGQPCPRCKRHHRHKPGYPQRPRQAKWPSRRKRPLLPIIQTGKARRRTGKIRGDSKASTLSDSTLSDRQVAPWGKVLRRADQTPSQAGKRASGQLPLRTRRTGKAVRITVDLSASLSGAQWG